MENSVGTSVEVRRQGTGQEYPTKAPGWPRSADPGPLGSPRGLWAWGSRRYTLNVHTLVTNSQLRLRLPHSLQVPPLSALHDS